MELKVTFSNRKVENFIEGLDYSKCIILTYDSNFYHDTNNNVYKLNLDKKSNQIVAGSDDNIYIILDIDSNEILYIGKSLKEKMISRLNEHLLKNEKVDGTKTTTSSKIKNVYEYLSKRRANNDSLEIKYLTFTVSPANYYAAVEGYLINYVKEKKSQAKWNIRRG